MAVAAFSLEQKIKASAVRINEGWWELAELLYEFHEGGYWRALNYDTLDDFLVQPELGISRALFFQMTRVWRDLVVTREVDPDRLRQLEPSKVRQVTPAIVKGNVTIDKALADAATLGFRDICEHYKGGVLNDGKLAAEDEPERVQCQECGAWRTPDQLREWGERND